MVKNTAGMVEELIKQSAAPDANEIRKAYQSARKRYAALNINTKDAIKTALQVPVSLHCWQADDLAGLDTSAQGAGDGIAVTGNYPGAARCGDEIRTDIDEACKLLPGAYRINLHAMYAETEGKAVGRDKVAPEHFANWISWAKKNGYGLDFNPSPFGHPMVKQGMTLSSHDSKIRRYWINHIKASRNVAAAMAKSLGDCTFNIWIPDGCKEDPADRLSPRLRLRHSLDEILHQQSRGVRDVVESKLFGIGCESYTVGSSEFYLAYACNRKNLGVCFDLGHFHPTESVADKVSAVAPFLPFMLFHVSRGVRWDSDHVCLLNQEVQSLCDEIVRHKLLSKSCLGLDFFDGSINRTSAYVLGARTVRKALLFALLNPYSQADSMEKAGKNAYSLALKEYSHELPFAAVWDYLCLENKVPVGMSWIKNVQDYEDRVLSRRG